MAAKSSQEIAHFTARVIHRASAFALQGYKHCCHVMLHCPTEARLFSYYPIKHAVLVSVHVLLNNCGWQTWTSRFDSCLPEGAQPVNLLSFHRIRIVPSVFWRVLLSKIMKRSISNVRNGRQLLEWFISNGMISLKTKRISLTSWPLLGKYNKVSLIGNELKSFNPGHLLSQLQ